jgi:hypothetical protein
MHLKKKKKKDSKLILWLKKPHHQNCVVCKFSSHLLFKNNNEWESCIMHYVIIAVKEEIKYTGNVNVALKDDKW